MTSERTTVQTTPPGLPEGVRAWLRAEGVIGLAGGWLAWLAISGEPLWAEPAPGRAAAVDLEPSGRELGRW